VDVLVFTNPRDPAKERFFQAISEVPSLSPKFVLERERFVALLRNNANNWKAIVFFIYKQDDLDLAHSLKAYLKHSRLIFVLPDWDGERVKVALSLSPSLMTKANGDFSDVVAVLEKIATLTH
jgi:predicted protein tyrosine phosphatase